MVRVITIADDVYNELKKIKEARGMSFSEVLRYLIKERRASSSLLSFAGSLEEKKLKKRIYKQFKGGEQSLF